MKICPIPSLLLLLLCPFAILALLETEAGINDFVVHTAGHGLGTNVVYVGDEHFVTTGSTSPCVVAARSIQDGSLLWRRNACTDESNKNDNVSVQTTTVDNKYLMTASSEGTMRCWTLDDGVLVWDALTAAAAPKLMWGAKTQSFRLVATAKDDELEIRNADNGRILSTNMKQKNGSWLHVMASSEDDTLLALVGSTKDMKVVKGSSLSLIEVQIGQDGVNVGKTMQLSNVADFLLESLVVQQMSGGESHGLALTADKNQLVQFSLSTNEGSSFALDLPQFHPLWTTMERIETSASGLIRIIGQDNRYNPPKSTMALFRYEPSDQSYDQWYEVEGDEETQFDAIGYCEDMSVVVGLSSGHVEAFFVDKAAHESANAESTERRTRNQRHRELSPLYSIILTKDEEIAFSETDSVSDFTVLSCTASSMSALLTTSKGTTMKMTVSKSSADQVDLSVAWTQEEGLSHVSSALLLDASHHSLPVLDTMISEEEQLETLKNLTFSSRLQLQAETFKSILLRTSTPNSRDHNFGFVKVAVLLSSSAHRAWGMLTSGDKRGLISWSLDLPDNAEWHTLVHGTFSSTTGAHGSGSGIHSPETLLLSSIPQNDGTVKIEWTCLEGTTGAVHATGSSASLPPVAQVIPVYGGDACHQGALLLHKDGSLSALPNGDEKTVAAIVDHIHSQRNGMFTHLVDREKATFESFQIVEEGKKLSTTPVGRTTFAGETIVAVSYPMREEVVQSPSTALGDDSLLLKYLNPHLSVVVTMSNDAETSGLTEALNKKNSGTNKRKPKGATQPGDTPAVDTPQAEDAPNLFVNVMDTVSGRVLYRASHSNAQPGQDVPVLVTENWVIYAFFNEKVKRTELGVLSLYEGMIDKNGITAFTSPEQAISFSSLDTRDVKPVVLTKTYTLPKTVTALGATMTRGGISTPHVIFATGDDKIMSLSRHVLEPRRPTGEVKESEKKEGLVQYYPLINFPPVWSPSYNQTVHGATMILSAPAALESQSLVMAVGGADLFFARMSPSKGFDLLPDSFNRILLAIVVVALLGVVVVLRGMSKRKIVKTGWA